MNAKEFFNNQISTDANKCFVDIYAHKYDRNDLFRFAEAYHKAKRKEELIKYGIWCGHNKIETEEAVKKYLKERTNGNKRQTN